MRKPRPRKIKQLAEFAQLLSSGAQTTTYQEEPSKRKIRGPHSYLPHVKSCREEGRETYGVAPGGGTRTGEPWWDRASKHPPPSVGKGETWGTSPVSQFSSVQSVSCV